MKSCAVGKWEGPLLGFPLFHSSSRRWEWGNRRFCDFQGLWARRETCFWFSSASMARHFHRRFHAVLFCRISVNNFRLASCIRMATVVSLSAPARFSKSACVVPGFSRRAKSGNCRRISHGVAYHRSPSSVCPSYWLPPRALRTADDSSDRDSSAFRKTPQWPPHAAIDVPVPHMFSDHRSVLGFYQPVVIALPWPRFGLLHQELV